MPTMTAAPCGTPATRIDLRPWAAQQSAHLRAAYAAPSARKVQTRRWSPSHQIALASEGVEAYARPIRSGASIRWQIIYRAHASAIDALLAIQGSYLCVDGSLTCSRSKCLTSWGIEA